jgi:hypothetical protein
MGFESLTHICCKILIMLGYFIMVCGLREKRGVYATIGGGNKLDELRIGSGTGSMAVGIRKY